MKKMIIGALVGGLLIFVWQTLSWAVLDLHRPAQDYTPKQDTIMAVLNGNLDKEGGYLLPNMPAGTSMDEATKLGEKMNGKPWASIQYHKVHNFSMNTMYINMAQGLFCCIVLVYMLIWIIARMERPNYRTIFLTSLFVGFIVFLNAPYNSHIWYKSFDIHIHFLDAVVSWGLTGIWLGWWLRR